MTSKIIGLILSLFLAYPVQAVVQWSRQYQLPCTACHTAYPRLNETGILFRRAGYRFAGDSPSTKPLDFLGATTSPTFNIRPAGGTGALLRGYKVHLGGALPGGVGFLVQPTPGELSDFNMIQGMSAWRDKGADWRFVAGRLYAWGNGGGTGASDRFPTTTAPTLFGAQGGIAPGSVGGGFRVERADRKGGTLSLFSTDLSGAGKSAPTQGIAVARTRDGITLEGSLAVSRVAGRTESRALVTGLYDPKGEGPRPELLWGALYGSGMGERFGSGFLETDWLDGRGGVGFVRWNTDTLGGRGELRHGATAGIGLPLAPLVRFDLDVPVRRRAAVEPSLTARLRLFL